MFAQLFFNMKCIVSTFAALIIIHMKKVLFLTAVFLVLLSCTKQDSSFTNQANNKEAYLERFAIILSKAAFENEDLRHFLKEQALKQFDMDYDVFYPLVKNTEVSDGESFRSCLLNYCSIEDLLEIENNLPLLTILIPDWGWLGAFSVEQWDTAKSIVYSSYATDRDNKPVYFNGKHSFSMSKGEIPEDAILIVKNNERMVLSSPATKSSEAKYDFVNPAFDHNNEINTKANRDWHYEDIVLDENASEPSDFVPEYDN